MPEPWRIKQAATLLTDRLKRQIDMAATFFSEASVLVLVFGLLDPYVYNSNHKIDYHFARVIVGASFVSYVLAAALPRLVRWVCWLLAWMVLSLAEWMQ